MPALLAHLPVPADAGLRRAIRSTFGGAVSPVMTLAWLPSGRLGGAYNVEGTADCAGWVFFKRSGVSVHPVPHPKVNNGCWNHVLHLVQWQERAIVVNVGDGLIDPHVDLQLQAWDKGHWTTEERLRLRFARKVALISTNCELKTYCALVKRVGLRVATRYDRRPLPQTLAPLIASLSKADRARFAALRTMVDCAGGDAELPGFGTGSHWTGMTGFSSEAAAFPVHVGGKVVLGCISHAHLGWRISGVWLVGFWDAMGKRPVPLGGIVAGGRGAFLVAAPLKPRVVNR